MAGCAICIGPGKICGGGELTAWLCTADFWDVEISVMASTHTLPGLSFLSSSIGSLLSLVEWSLPLDSDSSSEVVTFSLTFFSNLVFFTAAAGKRIFSFGGGGVYLSSKSLAFS